MVFFVQHILSINHYGPIIAFSRLDQYEIRSSLVQFSFFFIWTNTKFVLPWSNDLFSSFGPIRNSFFFGPFISFLRLDQFELHSPLVHLSLFFIWTNSKFVLLWSNDFFSSFGPIRNSFFFGPFISFLYLDQFELHSPLVHLSIFFIWTNSLSRNIKKRLGEGAFLLVH